MMVQAYRKWRIVVKPTEWIEILIFLSLIGVATGVLILPNSLPNL